MSVRSTGSNTACALVRQIPTSTAGGPATSLSAMASSRPAAFALESQPANATAASGSATTVRVNCFRILGSPNGSNLFVC